MKGFQRAAVWWLCAGLGLFVGCAGHRTSPRTAHLLDDKVITERVEVALHQVSPHTFSKVHVDTSGAVVTLSGSVPSLPAKEKASRIAQNVEKVRGVANELQVR